MISRWEVDVDAVFLDGQRLQASEVPVLDNVDSTKTSALIDTVYAPFGKLFEPLTHEGSTLWGNSLIRGPEDVVNTILQTVSPSYQPTNEDSKPIFPCSNAHTLAFQIGGKASTPIKYPCHTIQLNYSSLNRCSRWTRVILSANLNPMMLQAA
jgi:hypothetical protein